MGYPSFCREKSIMATQKNGRNWPIINLLAALVVITFSFGAFESQALPNKANTLAPAQTGLSQTAPLTHGNGNNGSAGAEWAQGQILVKFRTDNQPLREKLESFEAVQAKALLQKTAQGADEQIVTFGVESIDSLNKRHNVRAMKRVFTSVKARILNSQTRSKEQAKKLPGLSTIYLLNVAKDADIPSVVAEYQRDPNVVYAEPNYIYRTFETIPNDPDFDQQWALEKIQAPAAWDIETGSLDVVIAIIDTGVDWDHPDLAANIWINPGEDLNGNGVVDPEEFNGVDDDGNGYVDDIRGYDFVSISSDSVYPGEDPGPPDNDPMDFDGHGTFCAGIAGAVTDNSIGVAGTAWNCKIMTVRAGYKGISGGGYLSVSDTSAGIHYAALNGANIISMSFGSPFPSDTEQDVIEFAQSLGCLCVGAAGNEGEISKTYPSAYEDVIAVGATDTNDQKVGFSNFGIWVDVSAPGVSIYSTYVDNSYASFSGTSASAPIVAGVAGLIWSLHPNYCNTEVRDIIVSTIEPINSERYIGSGRTNAYKAVTSEKMPTAKLSSPEDQTLLKGIVPIIGNACGENFQSYTIEYGQSTILEVPTVWIPIHSSSIEVTSGVLAEWDVTNLSGLYQLRLSVWSASGLKIERRIEVIVDNTIRDGWPVRIDDIYSFNPAVADLDADGQNEIVCSTTNKLYLFDPGGNILPGFPVIIGKDGTSMASSRDFFPSIGNVDGDANLEIVLGYETTDLYDIQRRAVYVFNSDGSILDGWPVEVCGNAPWGAIAMFDVDNDGTLEIIFGCGNQVFVYNGDGSPVDGWPQSVNGSAGYVCPAVGDIDNDGIPEIVAVPEGNTVYIWHNDGSFAFGWPQEMEGGSGQDVLKTPVMADIDKDGGMEIITACTGSDTFGPKVYVWNTDGSMQVGWPQTIGLNNGVIHSVVVSDVDNDPELELISCAYGSFTPTSLPNEDQELRIWNHDGTTVDGWPIQYLGQKSSTFAKSILTPPIVLDIDEDSEREIIVAIAETTDAATCGCDRQCWQSRYHAFNPDGTELQSEWPKEVFGASKLLTADIDLDGFTEILGYSAVKQICVWDLTTPWNEKPDDWPVYRKNNQRTGCYATGPVTFPEALISSPREGDVMDAPFDIMGTAKNAAFRDYKVEYGEGYEPASWTLLNSSNLPVNNGVMATLDTTGFKGLYTIRLTVNSGSENEKMAMVHFFSHIYLSGWPKFFDLETFPPLIEDIDHNGSNELIVLAGENLHVFDHTGAEKAGWPQKALRTSYGGITVGDIDASGNKEIVCVARDSIFAFSSEGSILPGWPVTLPSSQRNEDMCPVLGDINGDGFLEVILATLEHLYVWEKDGKIASGWPKPLNNNRFSRPAVGDVNADGTLEIAVSDMDNIYVFKGDGTALSGWPQHHNLSIWGPGRPLVLGDLDGDGCSEIIAYENLYEDQLGVWRHDGTKIRNISSLSSEEFLVADLDKDGDLEIVSGTYGLYAYHHTGENVMGWPVEIHNLKGRPAVGNIDTSETPEAVMCEYIANYMESYVHAWSSAGEVLNDWELPRRIDTWKCRMPVIDDLDNDGDVEIVVTGMDDPGVIYVFDLDGLYNENEMEWPMWNHDTHNTSWYGYESVKPQAITDLSLIQSGDDITLQWSPVVDDTEGNPEQLRHYKVYRSTNPAFTPTNSDLLDITTDSQCVDVGGNLDNYCYIVRTLDKSCNLSQVSNRVMNFVSIEFSADKRDTAVGEAVQFAVTVAGGIPPLTYEWDFDNDGTIDSTEENPGYAYGTAGNYTVSLTATDSAGNKDTVTKVGYITVIASVVSFEVTTQHSGTETAGYPFSVTLTAKDANGNTATGYEGDHNIAWVWAASNSPNGISPTKPTDGNQTYTAGVATISGFILTNSNETPTITATAKDVSGTSDPITVNNGALDHVKVESAAGGTGAEIDTYSMTADEALTVHAIGYDAWGNYREDVSVNWSGTGVCSGHLNPTDGTSTTTFTPVTAGTGTIRADHATAADDATGEVTVTAGVLDHIVIEDAPGGTGNAVDTVIINTDQTYTVYAVGYDAEGNYLEDVLVTWLWTSGDFDAADLSETAATALTIFGPNNPGSGVLKADDGEGHTDTTSTFTAIDVNTDRIYSCGFELNSLTELSGTGGTGTANLIASHRHGADYAFETSKATDPGAAFGEVQYAVDDTAGEASYYYRFYLYANEKVSESGEIIALNTSAGDAKVGIRLSTLNGLTLYNLEDGHAIGNPSSELLTNTWYRVSLSYNARTRNNTTVSARINGTQFAGGSIDLDAAPSKALFGLVTANTGRLFWDDLAINRETWPGDGIIHILMPDGAGDFTEWSPMGGDNYEVVNERPPDDDTTYVKSMYNFAVIDDYNVTNWPGNSSDTLNLIQIGVRFSGTESASNSFAVRCKAVSGGTVAQSPNVFTHFSGYKTNDRDTNNYPLTLSKIPGTDALWTGADINSAQIGIIDTDTALDEYPVSTLWMLVETTEGTKPTVTVSVSPDPAKAGVVTFDLTFNEAMDTSVSPTVSFGKVDPYNQETVSGAFTDANHWCGTATVESGNDGTNTIKVSAAKDLSGNSMNEDTANSFVVDCTVPTKATVTTPVDKTYYETLPGTFEGSVADNAGSGLAENSSEFYIKDETANKYWDGDSWETAQTWLSTTHSSTTYETSQNWQADTTSVSWTDGHIYTSLARATDRAGNRYEGNEATFYYDAAGTGFVGHFDFATIAGQTAGAAFGVTVTAKDAGGNRVTTFTGIADLTDTTDTIVPATTGSFSSGTWTGNVTISKAQEGVVITAKEGSSSGSSAAFNVNSANGQFFRITGSSSMTAGGSKELSLTAYDKHGNVVTGYTGDKTLVFSGATASPNPHDPTCSEKDGTDVVFGNNTVLTFANGVSTTTLKLYNAETANIKASEGDVTTSDEDDLDVTVSPGTKNKLLWATQPPSSVKAGETWTAFSIEITDLYGNRTADTDAVTIAPSSGTLDGTLTQAAVSGLATFDHISCGATGSITLTGSASGLTDTPASNTVEVTAGDAASFAVATEHSGTETAGTAFSVTLTAKDVNGNATPDYTGDKAITWTWTATNAPAGTSPTKPADGTRTFTAGVCKVSGFTLTNSSETPTITATDGAVSGASSAVTVYYGPLHHVRVESAAQGAGSEISTHTMTADDTLTVYAAGYDAFGNYWEDVSVNWSGAGVCSGNLNPTSGKSTTFTPVKAGSGTISADHAAALDDSTGEVRVNPGTLDHIVIEDAPGGTGSAVDTLIITTFQDYTVYAVGYDSENNYLRDVAVNWSWTSGDFDAGDLSETGPSTSTTFTPDNPGSGVLHADDGTGHDDSTGNLTSTEETDCPDCSGDDPIVQNVIFEAGMNCDCEGKNTLTIGPGVEIKKDATVRFKAPKVTIKSGVNAHEGSTVSIHQ